MSSLNIESKYLGLFLSAVLVCLGACATPGGDNGVPTTTQAAKQVGWGIYMVGSDLEDDVSPRNGEGDEKESGEISKRGAGSTDLREMVAAFKSFSVQQQKDLDLVVAFGGARKSGWQGIKYADMPCLVQDAEDDYFGNAECYLYQDDAPSLSESQPLAGFIQFLKPRFASKDRRLFSLWNHGAAYLGVGNDSRQGDDAMVTLPELKTAFEETQSHFDLLGFDACLMASVEVAQIVSPFADYLVASEDLEPGHGWDYTQILTWIKEHPEVDIEALGRYLVDSFIDSPKHQKTQNKTLSLLRLTEVPEMVAEIDRLTQQLSADTFAALMQARRKTQEYGVHDRGKIVYAIDLKDWLLKLKAEVPGVNAQAGIAQFEKMLIHSRGDKYSGVAEGLTVFSLNSLMKASYQAGEAVSANYLNFADQFVKSVATDQIAPELSQVDFQTQQADQTLCDGICVKIQDNQGLKKIEQMLSLVTPDRQTLYAIGSRPVTELSGNIYQAPSWDGEWFLLCNGSCDNGLSIFPALFFKGFTQQKTRIYQGEVLFNGREALLYIEQDALQNVIKTWVVPFTNRSDGIPLLAKEQLEVGVGDTLQFYFRVINLKQQSESWELGDSLTFSQAPSWNFAALDAERVHHIQAEDFNGNISTSQLYSVRQVK